MSNLMGWSCYEGKLDSYQFNILKPNISQGTSTKMPDWEKNASKNSYLYHGFEGKVLKSAYNPVRKLAFRSESVSSWKRIPE